MNDITLARKISLGDQDAFKAAYDRYSPMLYALASEMLRDGDEAAGAVQSVFVKLWENRQSIAITTSLRNYLYTCTKHYILNRIRNRANQERLNERFARFQVELELSPDQKMEEAESMMRLEAAIAELPHQQERVVNLKRQGYSNSEISKIMGVSLTTIKFHYSQVLKTLRKKFR